MKEISIRHLNLFLIAAMLIAALGISSPVMLARAATTITVNTNADNTTDDGLCTLREAITTANTNAPVNGADDCNHDGSSGTDTINFAADYTITLVGSQLPAVTSAITINGNGAVNTIIQANASPNTATYRVLEVGSAGNLTLNDTTIANGHPSDGGGGILNNGDLTITNSILSGNSAASDFGGAAGGAIENDGTLTIQSSAFSGNSAISNFTPAAYGGAIINVGGTVTIQNSTFSGNSAIGLSGGGALGGAIHSGSGGTLTIVNSTFSDNHATENSGSGMGGAIVNSATLTIKNSTFSGNSASSGGGGILNQATLNLENTILANNTTDTGNNDCVNSGGDTIATNINNLIENNAASGNMCGTPSFTADPSLGPLANNGGSTQTHALLAGSPAIDEGNDAVCVAAPVNNESQNGLSRPQGAHCDIGAYEAALPSVELNPSSLNFGSQLVGTTSPAQTVTVTNTGTADLTLGALSISGQFALNNNLCNGKTLAPAQKCTFGVTFKPLNSGVKNGKVSIPSNTASSPDAVTLNGVGVAGTQLLKMWNFEGLPNPLPWKVSWPTWDIISLRDCRISVSLSCSAKLTGYTRDPLLTIRQTIHRSGNAGDRFFFGLSSRAKDIPTGGQYRVQVLFYDANGLVGSKSLAFANGTHAFQTVGANYTVPGAYTLIIYRITFGKPTGVAWFDDAMLILYP